MWQTSGTVHMSDGIKGRHVNKNPERLFKDTHPAARVAVHRGTTGMPQASDTAHAKEGGT